jgi:lysophospholipase L1-like esterase
MDSGQPQVRYYDTRRTRPWYFVCLGVGVVAATVGVWFGTDLLRAEGPSPRGVVTVNGVFDEQAAEAGAEPVITPADPDDDPIDATSMAMVGDSITDGSTDALRYTLAAQGFTEVTIEAQTSRRIELGDGNGSPTSGVATLFAMLGDPDIDPDVWVIALGTNDVGQYKESEDYRRLVRLVLDMLPDDVPLVWVDTYRADRPAESEQFNEILLDEVSQRGDSVVASWHDQASRDDETEVLRDDGVHPNQHGRVVFAALVAEGIAAVT